MQSTAAPQLAPAAVQTIEQTSKQFKVGQLIGAAMIIGSFVACSEGHWHASPWLFILGILVYIGARMGAWWNNG